ncbi:MAG: cation transporter, partial [Hamadaea sp.]|nr:cation transporter [Hamadaea sp.]
LLRDSGRVLLEAAPAGLQPEAIGDQLAGVPGVVEVHDLHVWAITSGQPALSAHVLVDPGRDCHAVRGQLENLLHKHQISHTTLQVDHATGDLLTIGRQPDAQHCADAHGRVHTKAV